MFTYAGDGGLHSIHDSVTNETAAQYTYDSWGNILTATGTLAVINPFRYRGYYYDKETDFYYLQSRYYDAAVGRFINEDAFASTGQGILGNNMFAYCNNNPIIFCDPTGHWFVLSMFVDSVEGDGSFKEFDQNSELSKCLAKSTALNKIFDENVKKFKASEPTRYGDYVGVFDTYTVESFADKELSLSVGEARYYMLVYKETKTTEFFGMEITSSRYVAACYVYDTYDFTKLRSDDSLGTVLNNLAYFGQTIGLIVPYDWRADVIMYTDWECEKIK